MDAGISKVAFPGDVMMKYRSFRFTKYLLFLLLPVPVLTEYLEAGHLPRDFRDVITETLLTVITGAVIAVIFRQSRQLERLSLTDPLTGIPNRRLFEIDLRRETERAKRLNIRLGMLFFDLDNFKQINDRHGHKKGDEALVIFARQLTSFTRRGTDYCYRFGGDEFVVLLTEVDKGEAGEVERRIDERLRAELYDRLPSGISVSRGIALLKENESPDEFLKRADSIMLQEKAKAHGD